MLDFAALFTMQKDLDEYITNNHDLSDEALFEESILAVLVELGELANETRCFKFWSTKTRSESSIILEEYVDNIHFLLSIGLSKGYEFHTITFAEPRLNETDQFLLIFDNCITFYKESSEGNYIKLFKSYLQLANILGFSGIDIKEAYHKKNEVNYKRQQAGY